MFTAITSWYDEHGRDLPWRHPTAPWGILVCEVMSQQTPVARILDPWHAWMTRWPTPKDLAQASPADVVRAWGSLGYPRRALRLHECAQVITETFGGEVPDSEEDLLSLPGIGPYTAAAVMAFGFTQRSVVLDTNIRRVIARLHGEALPAPSMTKAEAARAASLVPDGDREASVWNAAIMELGALVCTAKNPRCEACPVADQCQWRAAGYPSDEHAGRRKTQAWAGTMRQARGLIMGVLRSADEPVSVDRILEALDDRGPQALAGLVTDGLVERSGELVGLPGSLGS